MRISVNGAICEESEAVVSVYDHGFLYGMGLFETFRTYGGRPFLLTQHLNRLERGCGQVGIEYVPDQVRLEQHIAELLQVNNLEDGYIRLSVSAGIDKLGLPNERYAQPNVIIYMKALPTLDDSLDEIGKPLQLLQLRRNTPDGSVRSKSFQFMNNIMAKQELRRYPWAVGAEGLFLNEQGYVTEGIVSNLFYMKEGICYTPAIDTGILPGITREFVIEIATRMGLKVQEGYYVWDDVRLADELFVTNSIQEIVPIIRCYNEIGTGENIGNGRMGDITRRLIEQYRQAARAGHKCV